MEARKVDPMLMPTTRATTAAVMTKPPVNPDMPYLQATATMTTTIAHSIFTR